MSGNSTNEELASYFRKLSHSINDLVFHVPLPAPVTISDPEFRQIALGFSEAGGSFPWDNILSNELPFQNAIPKVKQTVQPGGAYLGVGPEQNFTYIAAFEPIIAFIVDIRRQNMLEHLLYRGEGDLTGWQDR